MSDSSQDSVNTSAHRDDTQSNGGEGGGDKRQPSEKTSGDAEREQDRQLESGEENPT